MKKKIMFAILLLVLLSGCSSEFWSISLGDSCDTKQDCLDSIESKGIEIQDPSLVKCEMNKCILDDPVDLNSGEEVVNEQ